MKKPFKGLPGSYLLLSVLLMLVAIPSFSQCLSGNCQNGKGTFDYGWCKYTGAFKNDKPEGQGKMEYANYTYSGNFKNGLEDGHGIIQNQDGSKEEAVYVTGVRQQVQLEKIAAADYKPLEAQDAGCTNGNCITGRGTYVFPSGNRYTGEFKNRQRDGQGTFFFADGDRFEGIFSHNHKESGTYFFNNGARYTGTYDEKDLEFNGTITSPQGMRIPYINGIPVIPPRPKILASVEGKASSAGGKTGEKIKMPCSVCFGSGKTSRTEDWSNYGGAQGGSRESYRLERVYSSCYKCHGSGVE